MFVARAGHLDRRCSLSKERDELISDEAARSLIRHAITTHERASAGMRIEDIHAALAELGISDAEFDAALKSHDSALLTRRIRPLSMLHAGSAGLALGAGTATLGTLLSPVPLVFIMAGAVFMLSGILAARNRPAGPVRYHLSNPALWFGCWAGYASVALWAKGHYMGLCFLLYPMPFVAAWALTSVAGMILGDFQVDGEEPTSKLSHVFSSIRAKLARALRKLVDTIEPMRRAAGLSN